ncbi:MAG: hypothetical protein WCC64_17035 [Aliidongia sp.]
MTQVIEINRSATVANIESAFARLASSPEGEVSRLRLKIGSNYEGGMLSDIWAAILAGTACRRYPTRLIAWGLQSDIETDTAFASTLAFLASLAIAEAVSPERGHDVDLASMRKHIAIQNKGLVDPHSGAAQTLVEFDPDHSVAPILRGGGGFASVTPLVRKKLFEQLILHFRRRLEIGALRRGFEPVGAGPAGDLGRFLAELHENGIEHGSHDTQGRRIAGSRFMRVRKHVANNKQQLIDRCGSVTELARHVELSVHTNGPAALIEASISDFGLGIVDAFTASPAAAGLTLGRRDLLESLVYERLSSKSSDPSAGLGIQKALDAARRMQAFVSLRTAEFWLTVSFAGGGAQPRLRDVGEGHHSAVAGTHWQILWHQP